MSKSSSLKLVGKTEAEEEETLQFKDGDGGDFVAGSIVGLLSGGPAMTVVGYDEATDTVAVAWFNDSELCVVELPAATLEAVEMVEE